MKTSFAWTPCRDLIAAPNFRDLARAYYNELWPEDAVKVDPDWDRMIALDEAGILRVWTAHVDRTLAGFITFHIAPQLHARSTLFAIDGGHYLSTAFRDIPWLGYRMWRTAEAALRELGVKAVLAHDNIEHPLAPFFLGLGYRPQGITWRKVL